jgi:hypothetical protein
MTESIPEVSIYRKVSTSLTILLCMTPLGSHYGFSASRLGERRRSSHTIKLLAEITVGEKVQIEARSVS